MDNRFRFHVLGLPHTAINKEYISCAYSQKLLKFAAMMVPRGHSVTMYSNELADVPCENVQILTEEERASWFGVHDRQKLYDLRWDPNEPYWRLFNERCVASLKLRIKRGDFILTCSGNCAQPVGDSIPGSYYGIWQTAALVEAFIGYYGTFSTYKIYESNSHREWMMGAAGIKGEDNSTAVVHNYWDTADFELVPRPKELNGISLEDPYFLFIGRVITDKGFDIAIETVKAIPGARLIIAGQGDPGILPPNVIRFGHATVAERNVLMQHAIATICPTRFREPFGGTAAESQICGTPAVTTDQGAFTETVPAIWRCASHRDFVNAARRAMALGRAERAAIRARAIGMWSFDAIAPRFEAYFQRLMDRWGSGWYQETPYGAPLASPLGGTFELPDPPGEPYFSSHHMAKGIFNGEEYDPQIAIEGVEHVLDIGANVGAFAVWARSKWPNAAVECFEPNPDAAAFCERNAPFAKVNRVAVTSQPSPVALWIDDSWGASRTFEPPIDGRRTEVQVIHPIDLPSTDVLKIDAEGVEPEILEAYPHLRSVKLCTYEYHRAAHREVLRDLCVHAGLHLIRETTHTNDVGIDVWVSQPTVE